MALRTPLYDWYVSAGARMIEFGGWDMPLQFTGIVEEHLAVRRAAGLFDVSHMGKILVQGSRAHAFLDGLSANDVAEKRGRARYTHLLREDGTTIDDVIITTLAKDRFFMVCNAGPRPTVLAWLEGHRPSDVTLRDLTPGYLCLALQGPRALEILAKFTHVALEAIRPFWGTVLDWTLPPEMEGWGFPAEDSVMEAAAELAPTSASPGPRVLATRTGYTGEPGFELFPPAEAGEAVWTALLDVGRPLGLKPAGLGARDTLRLEKGYLLSGQDFDGHQTPLELGCEWIVKWDRPFVGREALERQRARADFPRLVGLRMADRGIPRHGCEVLADGQSIGTVTSGTQSPSLRVGIALASLAPSHATPGTGVGVDIRGTPHPAEVVRPPFL